MRIYRPIVTLFLVIFHPVSGPTNLTTLPPEINVSLLGRGMTGAREVVQTGSESLGIEFSVRLRVSPAPTESTGGRIIPALSLVVPGIP